MASLRNRFPVAAGFLPSRNSRCALRQSTERSGIQNDDVRPFGLARNNRLVGDRLVGIAGQGGCNLVVAGGHNNSRPAVMDLPVNRELETQITILGGQPLAVGAGPVI